MDKFYTILEFSKILKLNVRTVSKLIRIGKIKALNVGCEKRAIYRIYDGELKRLMAENYNNTEESENG